ncbi:unnamed protein product, partial [Durusdinium trenchii]
DSWWLHIDYYWEKAAEDATWKSVINEDLAMKFLQRTDVGEQLNEEGIEFVKTLPCPPAGDDGSRKHGRGRGRS